MKVSTPEISWHERDPVYSVDFQPGKRSIQRLATGGVDKYVRIWQVLTDIDGKASVEFLAHLNRHTKAVNVCRFSPDGDCLASAGDDCVIVFWKLSDSQATGNNIFQEEDEDNKESWITQKVLRGHLEDIYDLCWSADGKNMVSGSVDSSAILWDLTKDCKLALFNDHKSFVQGVTWDPRNEYVATMSTDRSCRVFSISGRNCVHNISRVTLPPNSINSKQEEGVESKDCNKPKSIRMYHDDTMKSFFRRLTFSPDGELLITPSGCLEYDNKIVNSTYIFTRHNLSKPVLFLPSQEKATVAVRCCPVLFQLRKLNAISSEVNHIMKDEENNNQKEWEKYSTLFCLPYRVVFAVATEDSVLLYDTQQEQPFAYITNIHYHQLSDLSWSSDGRILVVSSTDGYCTLVTFKDGEIGIHYEPPTEKSSSEVNEKKTKEAIFSNGIEVETDTKDEEKKPEDNETTEFHVNGIVQNEIVPPEISMDSDRSSPDLHLVLEISCDGTESKDQDVQKDSVKDSKPLEFKKPSFSPRPSGSRSHQSVTHDTALKHPGAGPALKPLSSTASSPNSLPQMTAKSSSGAKRVAFTTLTLFKSDSK
ncbi:hypothetical protein CHS0354_020236 [Potamilus streckersoni]|uniref:Chromatin assembly factor 1 subunit B n=1 Tax=Potamilus streckersoni TaxID=2493646 RepID=A0AAE0S697_9BIVA|nr:hypothetical protein CHS0354_020236 [Potamilus streckersoni]